MAGGESGVSVLGRVVRWHEWLYVYSGFVLYGQGVKGAKDSARLV